MRPQPPARRPASRPATARSTRIPAGWRQVLLAAVLLVGTPASADPAMMRQADDLRQEARLARERNLILVLEFAADHCAYCRLLEENFLLPMQRNRAYDSKILIRSIPLNTYSTLIDFDGQLLKTEDFAARYGVVLTPTLLFLNSEGVEMSEKLVGIWSEDYFGGFIDQRIDAARSGL